MAAGERYLYEADGVSPRRLNGKWRRLVYSMGAQLRQAVLLVLQLAHLLVLEHQALLEALRPHLLISTYGPMFWTACGSTARRPFSVWIGIIA